MADYGRPLEFAQVSAAATKAAVGAVVWRAREGIEVSCEEIVSVTSVDQTAETATKDAAAAQETHADPDPLVSYEIDLVRQAIVDSLTTAPLYCGST